MLLRRHFFLTALVFAAILTISSYFTNYLRNLERIEFYRSHGDNFVSAIEARPGDRLEYIRNLVKTNSDMGYPVEIDVIRDGKSLLSGKPAGVPQVSDPKVYTSEVHLPEPATVVISFLKIPHKGLDPAFLIMLAAILLGSGLSVALLFWSLRERAEVAKNVFQRMQKGDLKARFPIRKLDEFGKPATLFNEMADEIERLVDQLQANEKHRLQLLQELAHDLRTPVSSLRNLIETLRFEDKRLEPSAREELMGLAYQETEYLTRLVEDLLFLAQVFEPKYKHHTDNVIVQELVNAQMTASATGRAGIKFGFAGDSRDGKSQLTGNRHLLQRLFRNAFENAFSFARSKVETEVRSEGGVLTVTIRDDGPGLTPESLENYGKKRTTRYQGSTTDGRLSVGLGSVIIQAIASAHGAQIEIRNLQDGAGVVTGAELRLVLPH